MNQSDVKKVQALEQIVANLSRIADSLFEISEHLCKNELKLEEVGKPDMSEARHT